MQDFRCRSPNARSFGQPFPKKRQLFGKFAEHHKVLAAEAEKAIAEQMAITQEPFAKEEE